MERTWPMWVVLIILILMITILLCIKWFTESRWYRYYQLSRTINWDAVDNIVDSVDSARGSIQSGRDTIDDIKGKIKRFIKDRELLNEVLDSEEWELI